MNLHQHWLDFALLGVLLLVAMGGWRRGFTIEALRYLGLLGGILLGAWIATQVGRMLPPQDTVQRMLIGAAIFLAIALACQQAGLWAGVNLRRYDAGRLGRGLEAAGGALVAGLVCLVVMWLLASMLVGGPMPVVARAVANSTVLQRIDRIAPPPPQALAGLKGLLDQSVFPQAFATLRPPVADGPPPAALDTLPIRRAATSTVRVESEGCGGLVFGSGFSVGGDLFVTNAHVVAGTTSQTVRTGDGGTHDATVLVFDPIRDLAVLHVPGTGVAPLRIAGGVPPGTRGVVIGYPGGGPQEVIGAQVVSRTNAVGRDIYSSSLARRDIYVLRAQVRKGDSGGPLVNEAGHLIGVVFAASTMDPNEGYALTTDELRPALQAAQAGQAAADLGACAA
jgi:S1-C subfamily serine protease